MLVLILALQTKLNLEKPLTSCTVHYSVCIIQRLISGKGINPFMSIAKSKNYTLKVYFKRIFVLRFLSLSLKIKDLNA